MYSGREGEKPKEDGEVGWWRRGGGGGGGGGGHTLRGSVWENYRGAN